MSQLTATAAPKTTAPAPAANPFEALVCPRCGEAGNIDLRLNDLDTISCRECDAEITLTEIREMVAGWSRLIKWVDTAPTF